MRFLKGDFKDIHCNDISLEEGKLEKDNSDSDTYPSAEIAWTRDNIKSLSTTTTANRLDKDHGDRYSQVKGLISNKRLRNWNKNENNSSERSGDKENQNLSNDATFSPPLARQLFSKHGLFDIQEMDDDQPVDFDGKHPEWFRDQESQEKEKTSLKKIIEAPESNSSNSSKNSGIPNLIKEQKMMNKENIIDNNMIEPLKLSDKKEKKVKLKIKIWK